ncbi:uncharacterized protein LOC142784415 [Rhipicephalus microplus]|uniref:uncharacterized protein LOC142784415 n=1 Tax=Rhipicephalus microplus TaxID=6941 RepID=UPI003F6A69ED
MLYNPDRAAQIIYACFALHNIALHAGDWTFDEYVVEMPPVDDDDGKPRGSHMLTPRNVLLRDDSSAALSGTFFEVHRKALNHGQCPPAPLPPSPVPLPHAVLQKRCGWLIFSSPTAPAMNHHGVNV